MRILTVETFVLSNRRALVRVETDSGIVGWGEPVLENWARTSVAAVERMAEYLVGQDPRQITRHWQVLARGGFYRGGPVLHSALAGLDQALWDITGRALGAPVHELLGGACRDTVRVYSHANIDGRVGDLDLARRLVDQGITLVKVAPDGPQRFLETAANIELFVHQLTELREAIGPHVDFAVDLHGRFSVPQSIRVLRMLEPLMPAFVEEPLRPEHTHRIADIVRSTSVPIATGERLYSRSEFLPVLQAGIAIAQPDVSHAGGITELTRIAAAAEMWDVQVAPHCPLGPVALAASIQVDLAVPNFYAQEQGFNATYAGDADRRILLNPEVLTPVAGSIPRLTGPGLGIEIDEEAVRELAVVGALEPGSPIWSHPDGGFAEW